MFCPLRFTVQPPSGTEELVDRGCWKEACAWWLQTEVGCSVPVLATGAASTPRAILDLSRTIHAVGGFVLDLLKPLTAGK